MSRRKPKPRAEHAELLAAVDALLADPDEWFTPRDVVDWKPGLRNRGVTGPFVVVRLREEPYVVEHDNVAVAFQGEELDVELGHFHGEGEARTFTTFWVDGRRLERAT